jgi:ribulose-5-phosphate 4-epimerase/fuculose-1-phosphate aldolase
MSIPMIRYLMNDIEGLGTMSALAVANDIDQFARFAGGISYVLTLTKLCAASHIEGQLNQAKIAHRIGDMLAERHGLVAIHPNDTAIALYLIVLHEVKSIYLPGLAYAAHAVPNLYWANKAAFLYITDKSLVLGGRHTGVY